MSGAEENTRGTTGTFGQSTVGDLTVAGRLWRTRGATIYLLLLLLTPVLVGLASWSAYRRTQLPDIGLSVDNRLLVEGVDDRWAGVKTGDRVVSLDGVVYSGAAGDSTEVRSPKAWLHAALHHDDTPMRIVFERDGELFERTAEATPMKPWDVVAVFARVFTGATLMVMGLLTFLARPGVKVTWLMLLLAWDLGVFMFAKIGFFFDPRLSKEGGILPFIVAMSLGLHLMSLFPVALPWLERHPRRALILYVPLLPMPVVMALGMTRELTFLGSLSAAAASLLVLVFLYLQYRSVRETRGAQARSQYRAMLVGLVGGTVVPGVWNWLRLSFGTGASTFGAYYNALPLLIFAGMMSYAIARHNALEIDRFTAAILGYAATTGAMALIFAAVLVGIPLLLDNAALGESRAVLVTVTALTFAASSPLYRRIKRWIDTRFFRERADATSIAETLRDVVLSMQQGSREDAIDAGLRAAEVLRPDRIELWVLSKDKQRLVRHRSVGTTEADEPIDLDEPLGQALQNGQTAGVTGLCPRLMETGAQERLWGRQLAMAAPVMLRGLVGGFLAIGRKRSGAGYELEELSFLSIIAAQLSSALERAQSETDRIDRYPIERRIGTGGMAEVHLAWQMGPGGFERRVAVKRPLPHVSEDANAVDAFLDEARLAAQLRHANIAQVYDVGESRGTYFIVMEYIDGPSLRQILRSARDKGEMVPVRMAVAVVQAVLAALDYAHDHRDEQGRSMDLVHRDVTPRNVLMSRRGDVKLVDFGIARAQHQLHVTRTGTIKGTLPYMSPEQAIGGELDRRSDLYSVGVLLYELLTSKKPYPDGPDKAPPRSPRLIAPDIPEGLEPFLERCMAFDRQMRFSSAAEQSAALARALHPDEPATSAKIAAWLVDSCADLLVHDEAAEPVE
ncbi:MAG: protein kinase, partial [Polyangiaceae bacterium]